MIYTIYIKVYNLLVFYVEVDNILVFNRSIPYDMIYKEVYNTVLFTYKYII